MTNLPVQNISDVMQIVGRYEMHPGKWTDIPYSTAKELAENKNFRCESKELIGDYKFIDDGGTYLGWSSPMYYSDGYGSIAQEIIRTFIERTGVRLSLQLRDYDPSHYRFGGLPLKDWCDKAFVPRSIVERLMEPQDKCFYGIHMTWPREVHQHPFPRGIGYTMFETTSPPRDWAKSMNRCRRIATPCKQNKEAFRRIGVTVPIDVVVQGVNPVCWPERTEEDNLRHADGEFIFLMAAGITMRKNPLGAAEAFVMAFPKEKDVRLVLKTRGSQAASGFRDWANMLPRDDRIKLICEESTPSQMLAYMHAADCFVFPSHGEGFGLPPVQAMCTGLPVIVANNSGMAEYCDPKYNFPITCSEVKVPKCADGGFPDSWGDCGNWWEPDIHELAANMRWVYENRKDAANTGKRAAKWVRENWTIEHICNRLLDVVRQDFV